jgi:2-keto-4-pentenoate hydratase
MSPSQLDASLDSLAQRLEDAWESRRCIQPLSESEGLYSPERAYAIQRRWTDLRRARGEREIGHKIGLTSRAMQEQMGVGEPDYGSLWESRYFPARAGRAELPSERFLQPRAEGELAFLIGRPLANGQVTAEQVLAATDAIAVAVEVIDSRIEGWRIKLADTIADNASYGALTLGPWSTELRASDLRTLGMLVHHNGAPVVEAIGAAALGHPAHCVAWLANRLSSLGVGLHEGEIVLSGALGRSIPVQPGDVLTVETHGQPPLTAAFV